MSSPQERKDPQEFRNLDGVCVLGEVLDDNEDADVKVVSCACSDAVTMLSAFGGS